MCGYIACVERDGAPPDEAALQRAVARLAHRGPDGRGAYISGNVGLGHARLSIVGGPLGAQPLFNEDGSVAVVCNGEIYNCAALRRELISRGHVFATASDTEVLVHLYEEWPEDYLSRVVGMFSFALLDRRRRRLCIARDRLGIKPLFTRIDGGRLIAASEIKAILAYAAVPASLDGRAISDFLTLGYTLGPRTAFAGIQSLPGGHQIVFDLRTDTFEVTEYWRPAFPDVGHEDGRDLASAAAGFRDLFTETVLDHTLGEVPPTVFMSGGIDSTAIAGTLARAARDPLTTFSLTFDDRRFDESAYIDRLVEQYGLRAQRVLMTTWAVEELERAIYHLEQPQIVTLDVANLRLSAAARRHGFKFALAGDGSDEQLGGYDHFGAAEVLRGVEADNLEGAARAQALREGVASLGYPGDFQEAFPSIALEAPAVRARFGTMPPWYAIWSLNDAIKRPLLKDGWPPTLGPDSPLDDVCRPLHGPMRGVDEFDKSVYLELRTRLPNWILWRSDRDGMANGIEVRVPYLDHRVVEFLAGVPAALKRSRSGAKPLLQRAFEGLLPDAILRRRKFAFNTPMEWLFLDPPARVSELLGHDALTRSGVFDPRAVHALLADVRSGHDRGTLRLSLRMQTLIGVLTTQMLHEQFCRSHAPPP